MPRKGQPSAQLITLDVAKAVIAKLQSKGVPVTNFTETSDMYGTIAVDADDYTPPAPGVVMQYNADIWGCTQNLGEARVMLGTGGFSPFFKLAEVSFENSNPQLAAAQAYSAVLALNGVMPAINTALTV